MFTALGLFPDGEVGRHGGGDSAGFVGRETDTDGGDRARFPRPYVGLDGIAKGGPLRVTGIGVFAIGAGRWARFFG